MNDHNILVIPSFLYKLKEILVKLIKHRLQRAVTQTSYCEWIRSFQIKVNDTVDILKCKIKNDPPLIVLVSEFIMSGRG